MLAYLVEIILATKERPAKMRLRKKKFQVPKKKKPSSVEFCKDASDRPNVNCLGVLLPSENDFWSSVPASGHIFGEKRISVFRHSSQSKVGYSDLRVRVDENVGRFLFFFSKLNKFAT